MLFVGFAPGQIGGVVGGLVDKAKDAGGAISDAAHKTGKKIEKKLAVASDVLEMYADAFRPVPMIGHAEALTNGSTPPLRRPDFATL